MPIPNPATQPPMLTQFLIPKERITPILTGIVELQKRTDLSGKFARKAGRIRRALTLVEDRVVGEMQDLQEQFKRRDAEGTVIPVVSLNALGQVVFEKDGDGRDTDRPVILANKFYVSDQEAYDRERKDAERERTIVHCEAFSDAEIDGFKAISGTIIDAMLDLSATESEYRVPEDKSGEADDVEAAIGAPEEDDEEGRTAP